MDNKEQKEKLLALVQEAVDQDKALREKYQMGEKFRFIRDRLSVTLNLIQESLQAAEKEEEEKKPAAVAEDEVIIYVYLFNAQGIVLKSWLKMLKPDIFYEHSVNRPIYTDKSHIEGFIKRKPTKVQHGYLTISIKKDQIILSEAVASLKDIYDNPLIKIKEGSLKFERLIAFTHNDSDYVLNEEGELVKKVDF